MRALQGSAAIRDFFRNHRTPLYYVSTSPFNLLTAEACVNNLHFINTIDSFDGRHPHAFVPPDARTMGLQGFEAANNFLLQHPAVADYVRQTGSRGAVLFLMFDQLAETLARRLGLQVCLPSAALRKHLDNKVTATRIANRAGVPSVPNVLAGVENYATLRRAAQALGSDLVVQLPYGDSGKTTFFISTEADFERYASQISAQPAVKIMKRIRCRPLTIEGCVTSKGTLVGPLMTELIGCAELTPFRGGWCGNEAFSSNGSATLSPHIRQQALAATVAIGEQLSWAGYWGTFGIDFLQDQDTGALYFGELNPRITGATSLTTQLALDSGDDEDVPLLLFHLLESFGVE
jgi:biotin carboxylase